MTYNASATAATARKSVSVGPPSSVGVLTPAFCLAGVPAARGRGGASGGQPAVRVVERAEGRVRVGVVEGVEGVIGLGLELEVRAAPLVTDADRQLVPVRVPEERHVDAAAGAVRELSHGTDLCGGAVHGRHPRSCA